ncbi:MAG: prepilin-type N-terminal cleavage/methylation domain-containing protein [Candidatus Omnitrophota bacterium]
MRKGFTLLELIIVIIIIGVLATLGFTQYTKVVEKGRAAEARAILGTLRTAENAYFQEFGVYTATVTELGLELPSAACLTTHYFRYTCALATGTCTATRCIAGGKTPNAAVVYNKTLDQAGVFGGTAGY